MGDAANFWESIKTARRSKPMIMPDSTQGQGSAAVGESSVVRESREPATKSSNLATERRVTERVWVSASVRVRAMQDAEGAPDEIGTTLNVSRTGFLFKGQPGTFTLGMPVRVTFAYVPSAANPRAERSGCVVRVSNLPDGSCTVAVVLAPMGRGMTETSSERRAHSAGDSQVPVPGKPVILAVDIDPAVRVTAKEHLSGMGYEVIAVSSCAEAADALRGLTPAAILVNPGVPAADEDRSGLHLCKQVQCDPRLRSVPLLLLMSEDYEGNYAGGHAPGANVRLSKLCSIDRVGYVVQLIAPLPHGRQQEPLLAAAHPEPHLPGDAAPSGNGSPARRYWLV